MTTSVENYLIFSYKFLFFSADTYRNVGVFALYK